MFLPGPSAIVPIMQSLARPILKNVVRTIRVALHLDQREREARALPFDEPRAKGGFVRT